MISQETRPAYNSPCTQAYWQTFPMKTTQERTNQKGATVNCAKYMDLDYHNLIYYVANPIFIINAYQSVNKCE